MQCFSAFTFASASIFDACRFVVVVHFFRFKLTGRTGLYTCSAPLLLLLLLLFSMRAVSSSWCIFYPFRTDWQDRDWTDGRKSFCRKRTRAIQHDDTESQYKSQASPHHHTVLTPQQTAERRAHCFTLRSPAPTRVQRYLVYLLGELFGAPASYPQPSPTRGVPLL